MTIPLDPDRHKQKPPLLPFDPADLDRCGIRMNRAEFSRFLGVTKQTVGDWVRSGKLLLGPDGLLDPRQAVGQLMRTTDPGKLRSKVLAPLVRDVGQLQRRITELESRLAETEGDAEFHEGASLELIAQFDALCRRLRDEWCDLRLLPAPQALAALSAWVAECREAGGDPEMEIMDCVPIQTNADEYSAPTVPGEGAG